MSEHPHKKAMDELLKSCEAKSQGMLFFVRMGAFMDTHEELDLAQLRDAVRGELKRLEAEFGEFNRSWQELDRIGRQ